jgi:hypothetical protein
MIPGLIPLVVLAVLNGYNSQEAQRQKADTLCHALIALYGGELPHDRLCRVADAIVAEAGGEDEATLASIGLGESGLNPWKVGKKYGACSTMQVLWSLDRARQDRRCQSILGNHRAAIRAGVQKIRDARSYCEGRAFRHLPTETCWLAGFQAGEKGPKALRAGQRWPLKRQVAVLKQAALIRRAVEARTPGAI